MIGEAEVKRCLADLLFGAHGMAPIRGKYEEGGAWASQAPARSALDYVHATANLSHSGFVVEGLRRPTHPTPSAYDLSKVVLTFHLSNPTTCISWSQTALGERLGSKEGTNDRSAQLVLSSLIADLAPR